MVRVGDMDISRLHDLPDPVLFVGWIASLGLLAIVIYTILKSRGK